MSTNNIENNMNQHLEDFLPTLMRRIKEQMGSSVCKRVFKFSLLYFILKKDNKPSELQDFI